MLWIFECEPRIPISKAYCHILGIKAKRSPAPNVSERSYLKEGDSVNEARVTRFNISVNDLVYVALSSEFEFQIFEDLSRLSVSHGRSPQSPSLRSVIGDFYRGLSALFCLRYKNVASFSNKTVIC